MKKLLTATAAVIALAGVAHAENDVEAGAKDFNKCKACHAIIDPAGEVIVKGGKTGPNLWGVVGRPLGQSDDFKYTDEMVALGAEGLVWTPELMAEYIPNAKAFLKDKTGDNAKTAMTPQKVKDVTDVIAFLAQYGDAADAAPAADAPAMEEATEEATDAATEETTEETTEGSN